MRRWGTAVLAGTLALGPIFTAEAAKVEAGAVDGVNLAAFGTYAWKDGAPFLPPEAHQALLDAATEVLGAKGYRPAAVGDADVVLSYKVLAVNRENVQAYGYANPDKWGIADYGGTDVQAYIQGRLTVFAEERGTGKLLWTGEGEAVVPDRDQAAKKVGKIATKIFRTWPKKN